MPDCPRSQARDVRPLTKVRYCKCSMRNRVDWGREIKSWKWLHDTERYDKTGCVCYGVIWQVWPPLFIRNFTYEVCYEYATISSEKKNILEVNNDFDFMIGLPQFIPLLFDGFRYGDQSDGGKTLALFWAKYCVVRLERIGTWLC